MNWTAEIIESPSQPKPRQYKKIPYRDAEALKSRKKLDDSSVVMIRESDPSKLFVRDVIRPQVRRQLSTEYMFSIRQLCGIKSSQRSAGVVPGVTVFAEITFAGACIVNY